MSGYDRSSVSMYVHAYLYQYVSALFTEQKRKYIIYGACRWIIAFNGNHKTSKQLWRALCTPLNSGGFPLVHTLLGHTSGVSWCFLKVFCCRMKRMWWWPYSGCIQSFTSIHIWFPQPWPWPAYRCSYNGRVLIPRESSLSAGSQLEHFILLVGWYLGVP